MNEKEYILVCVAWPYANADIHVGNVTGSYLPADIYARFHRLKGNHVLMVSGSDSHGTPVTVKAEELGKSVEAVFDLYHERFLDVFDRLGLAYDLFTHTNTENHARVSSDMFLALLKNGYLYKKVTRQMFSPVAGKFLPDRYIEGTCPNCGYERARGDQCDNCNTLFESAAQLIHPRSKVDDTALELRDTEHFFIDLPKLAKAGLEEWIQSGKEHWRPHVLNFTRNWILDEGLIGRAITRDLTDWGIPVPVEGYENKTLYVWFEAVIGYLSAAIEWAHNQGEPEAWKNWWYNRSARTVYFIGKDNIPFHALFWPAQLMGVGDRIAAGPLRLPDDIPANQYVTFKGGKASASRGVGLTIDEGLARFQPDALRYALAAAFPEQADTEISEEQIAARINEELVANWGNLVNRVLAMVHRNCDGAIPAPGPLEPEDDALLAGVDGFVQQSAKQFDGVQLRAALRTGMEAAQTVNQYLTATEPWKLVKSDPERGRTVLYVALAAINGVRIMLAPYLPFSAAALDEVLGQPEGWARAPLEVGRPIDKPTPLFAKVELDPEAAEAP